MIFKEDVPDIQSVNELLNYALGVLVVVIGYLYKEKRDETKDLNNKIAEIYEEHKNDLKEFSNEKTKTFFENNQTMQKMLLLLDQLKEMIRDDNNKR